MKHRPPQWADSFLQWFCDPHILEDIQGDLYELYHHRFFRMGKRYADIKFIWEVLRLIRIRLLRNPLRKETKIYIFMEQDRTNTGAIVKVLPLLHWNDIVFDSRNKDYGAYQIRGSYGRNMIFGFAVVLLIALVIVLWWWIQFR